MTNLRPHFTNFVSLFLVLFHLGCLLIFPTTRRHANPSRKQMSPATLLRVSPTKLKHHKFKSISSSTCSFIKRIFTLKPKSEITHKSSSVLHQVASPSSSTRSILTRPEINDPTRPGSEIEGADRNIVQSGSVDKRYPTRFGSGYLPQRHEIHVCQSCGEIFQKPGLLEEHRSIKHAVYELSDDDPSKNVVRIIFESGWTRRNPIIHRVMKIHNSPKTITRFEEYRERVKSTAARGTHRLNERCIADGNELLRFHCTTFLCKLGQNGNSTICTHQYCSACGIIGSGFSPKLDGISTFSNSWRGHVAIPEDIEEEFGFMNVKRAMLVCRVIAGRVGCDPGICDKDDPGYDSLVGRESGVVQTKVDDEDELIVFTPTAVLPCFVIVYTI